MRTLRPEAIKTVSDWATNYRRFREESFDKLDVVVNQMKKTETCFEDLGNGQTKLTLIGNETMEDAKSSGQLEGWNEILEKAAAVVAELAKLK